MSSSELTKLLHLFLPLLCLSVPAVVFSSPFSTLGIARSYDDTLVCALVPSPVAYRYQLNCTSIHSRVQRSYSDDVSYAAVAAGNGFLCGLTTSTADGSCTMRWWEFHRNGSEDYEKRVYWGPALASLASGETHVCGLIGGGNRLQCWRWPELDIPARLNFSEIAVGRDFVCGRQLGGGSVRCFGSDAEVVGKEPPGSFDMVSAGTWHVCGASDGGKLICWGAGAPELNPAPLDVAAMALGENSTCVLRSNGTVLCWGEASRPPDHLASEQFIAIQARGDAICGIMAINYSVVCWGNKLFRGNHTVYGSVMPGTCSPTASCSCGVLPDSGTMCAPEEGICQSCKLQLSSNSNSSSKQESGGGNKKRLLLLVLGSVGFGVGLLALLSFLVSLSSKNQSSGRVYNALRLTRRRRPSTNPLDGQSSSRTVEEFSLKFILEVTDSFSEVNKIGSGSFGAVYRAKLPGGCQVAIKRADISVPATASTTSSSSRRHEKLRRRDEQQRERAFWSELAVLSRVNHKNLVRLLGFCRESGERVLVYEYMANGTLHDHLHRRPVAPPSPLSSWTARLQIALDAARGIEYLHTYAVPAIIHRDIKSSNILLDERWTAKVADFGVSLTSAEEEGSVAAAGTVGYMDPEYYRLRRLTEKSDVYSFGVVLLELVTGCKAIHRSQEIEGEELEEEEEENEGSSTPRNVVEMAVPWIEADEVTRVMDRRVAPASAVEAEAVAYVGYVAAECVRAEGRERPTMGEVVGALERAVEACTAARAEPSERRSRALSRAQSLL